MFDKLGPLSFQGMAFSRRLLALEQSRLRRAAPVLINSAVHVSPKSCAQLLDHVLSHLAEDTERVCPTF